MRDEQAPAELPGNLRRYFWDYDPEGLTWERSKHTIVLRLLQAGGMDAVAWLRSRLSDAEIRDFLTRRQGRGIEPRRLRFWGLVLDLPRTQVDRWIAVARMNPWNRRTHTRRSLDLDWFTPEAIGDPMRLAAKVRAVLADFAVTGTDAGTLHGESGGVKFSFLEYRYPPLVPPVEWPEYACRLAGLEDLACMKLAAIAGRGARKDFIDIYALGRMQFSLDDMLALYGRKYGIEDVGHILMSLTYFDDAEAEDTPEMLWQVDWPDITRTIEGWVSESVRQNSGSG